MRRNRELVYFVILLARRADCNPGEMTRRLTRWSPAGRLSHLPQGAIMEPSRPRAALLVETDWLAEHLTDPSIRIVDIRGIIRPPDAPRPHYEGNRRAYLESHIPGAVFVH